MGLFAGLSVLKTVVVGVHTADILEGLWVFLLGLSVLKTVVVGVHSAYVLGCVGGIMGLFAGTLCADDSGGGCA